MKFLIDFIKSLFKKSPKVEPEREERVELPVENIVAHEWYEFALKEKGISESNNPDRVKWYHKHTKLEEKYWKPEISWCASFMSAILFNSGYKSPKTSWARDFANYGLKLSKPVKFCIMGFERNDPGGDSHVTLWTGEETDSHYICLGGNQGNAVSIAKYPKKDFLYAVWPVKETPQNGFKANWDHLPQAKEWTEILDKALEKHGQEMIRVDKVIDAAMWNSSFVGMSYTQRKQFFIMLISSMAEFESKFDPKCVYEEGFEDSQGNPVMSRGLLQLSKESVNQKAYGGNIKDPKELHDVKTNLECAVKILNYWIPKDKCIGSGKLGGARYWSVLRDSSKSQPKIRAKTKLL